MVLLVTMAITIIILSYKIAEIQEAYDALYRSEHEDEWEWEEFDKIDDNKDDNKVDEKSTARNRLKSEIIAEIINDIKPDIMDKITDVNDALCSISLELSQNQESVKELQDRLKDICAKNQTGKETK